MPERGRRSRPSYENGKLRDPDVERLQGHTYRAEDLKRAIRKALPRRKEKP